MKYTPKPKNKKWEIASIVLIVLAVSLFYMSSLEIFKWRAALQLISFATLAVGAFFLIRRLTVYNYIVTPTSKDSDEETEALKPSQLSFIVSQQKGERQLHVFSAELDGLKNVIELPTGKGRKALIKSEVGANFAKYLVTCRPFESYLLVFAKEGYNKCGIVLELEGEMLNYLKQVVKINKEEA